MSCLTRFRYVISAMTMFSDVSGLFNRNLGLKNVSAEVSYTFIRYNFLRVSHFCLQLAI